MSGKLYVATETFFAGDDRVRFVANQTLVWDDDPIVARHPDKFRPATAHFRSPDMVEKATAGPGERRGAQA